MPEIRSVKTELNQQMETILDFYQRKSSIGPWILGILTFMGTVVALSKILRFIFFFYKVSFRPSQNLPKRYGQGTWALVTGSSDGIGKQFAIAFAKRGFNIVLSARSKDKLQRVEKQIKIINPTCQVLSITTDFSLFNQEGYFEQFINQIEKLDISVLVNNVGLEFISPFHLADQKHLRNLVTVNTLPITILSQRLIQRFLKRSKRSAIINLASSVMQVPYGGYHAYTASKAYDDYLSRSLSYEYPQLDILSVRPSEVSTPMTNNKGIDLMTITAQQCAEAALDDLGYEQFTSGHVKHKIQRWVIDLFPESVINYVFKEIFMPSFIKQREEMEMEMEMVRKNRGNET